MDSVIYRNTKGYTKTSIVEGFIEIPKYPIIEAVIISGIKFGIRDTTTILKELNIHAIKMDISKTANIKLVNRFFTK